MGIESLTWQMALIVAVGVFLASFMDAIAGGGGIISIPTYLIAGLPAHMALGTNKVSAGIGSIASAARFVKNGYVDWVLALPSVGLALIGSHFGTSLQLMIPEVYLQYLLLLVLPVVAFVVLRQRTFPETAGEISRRRQTLIVLLASLIVGAYDGFYGPGTGTFMIMAFTMALSMDLLTASGCAKIANLCSNVASAVLFIISGKVWWLLALPAAACNMLGAYCGARYAMKGGSKRVRGMIFVVLGLLFIKMGYELLF